LEQSEREAIARLKQGDIGGLEILVRRYQLQAVRAAYLITRDRAMAEDLVQAAFIRAYERIAQFESERAFGPWFLRSVVNAALKAVTRRKDGLSLEQTWDGIEESSETAIIIADTTPGPEELLEQTETRLAIGEALNRLSPTQRATIVLRYYLGMSETAIAEQLGCSPGTVKWRLHAARQTLQTLLAELRPEQKAEAKLNKSTVQDGGKD
jgi:RNA polymerase sigma-70 factor (ECF subfamily)